MRMQLIFLLKVHPSPLPPFLFRQQHQRNSLFTLNIFFSVSSQSAQKQKACLALSQRRNQMLHHWNIAGRKLAGSVKQHRHWNIAGRKLACSVKQHRHWNIAGRKLAGSVKQHRHWNIAGRKLACSVKQHRHWNIAGRKLACSVKQHRHWNIAGRKLVCGVETMLPLKYRR